MPIIQVTIETDTHLVVPKVATLEMRCRIDEETDGYFAPEEIWAAAIDRAPPVPASPVDAFVWRCTQCGELPGIDPAWRWTGEIWQHHHTDVGHVDARPFRIDPVPASPPRMTSAGQSATPDALSEPARKEFESELRSYCNGFADEYYKCERGIEHASAASVNGKFNALLYLVHTYVFQCGTARIEGYKEALARSAMPTLRTRLTRDQAIALGAECRRMEHPTWHSVEPAEWVIDAIMRASGAAGEDAKKARMWDWCVSRGAFPVDMGGIRGWEMKNPRDVFLHSFGSAEDCVLHESGMSIDDLGPAIDDAMGKGGTA